MIYEATMLRPVKIFTSYRCDRNIGLQTNKPIKLPPNCQKYLENIWEHLNSLKDVQFYTCASCPRENVEFGHVPPTWNAFYIAQMDGNSRVFFRPSTTLLDAGCEKMALAITKEQRVPDLPTFREHCLINGCSAMCIL